MCGLLLFSFTGGVAVVCRGKWGMEGWAERLSSANLPPPAVATALVWYVRHSIGFGGTTGVMERGFSMAYPKGSRPMVHCSEVPYLMKGVLEQAIA